MLYDILLICLSALSRVKSGCNETFRINSKTTLIHHSYSFEDKGYLNIQLKREFTEEM